jgi:hypothetical protein
VSAVAAGAAVFDPVDDRAFVGAERPLESGQPLVDPFPARGDQVDQKGEVVDPGVPLAEHVALEPLEPSDELAGEAANLGEVLRHGQHLLAQAFLDGVAHALWEGGFELRRGFGKRFYLVAGPLEGRFHDGRLGSAFGRLPEPLVRPFDCAWIHGSQR